MNSNKSPLPKEVKKVIWAGIIGNSLELYDFSLYGYFAAILAMQFFPSDDYLCSLLMTYGIFASGFLLRPLGAILFGIIGDRYGRKKALELSIILMAVPTMLIGVLPTYVTAGIMAPIFLTILRMIQGLSVGGELAGSYSFLVEHAPESRKGFVGSWTLVGAFGGKLLGTTAVGIMSLLLTKNNLEQWGWRIPFILGLIIAFIGFYLRKRVSETPVFKKMKEDLTITKAPVRKVFKTCKTSVIHAAGTLMIHTVALYLVFVYLPIYLKTEIHLSYQQAVFSNFIALLMVIIFAPIGASISDRIGRKPVLLFGSLAMTLLAYPTFYLISTASYPIILATHWTFAFIFAVTHGPIPALFTEFFEPEIRYTALAISYNICVGLFGGMTPFVATWLISVTGSPLAPTYWLILCGSVSCIAVALLKQSPKPSIMTEELQHG